MTEAQGWVFIGLIALLTFVYLYRSLADVVRKRIKYSFWAILGFAVMATLIEMWVVG